MKRAIVLTLLTTILATSVLIAQVATIGTGTDTNVGTGAAPVNIYYRSNRTQTVYTAAEMNAAGMVGPSTITNLGYYITQAPGHDLPNFQIRIRHTDAADVSNHIDGPYEQVYFNALYSPTAGDWDTLTLTTPFAWNGVDNILVDTAFAQVPSWESTGQQRIFDAANGMRFVRSDGADLTDAATTTTVGYKPQIQLFFVSDFDFDNDLAATSISGPEIVNNNLPTNYTVTVFNVGVNAQNSYTVKLMKEGDLELASEVVTVNLQQFESTNVDLVWTPEVQEETFVYGKVVLTGDENPTNDETSPLDVLVIPDALVGTYSINHDGTGDYSSFTAATDYMSYVGVSGPVIFEVAPGTYTEQAIIPEITGVSETNTISFIGQNARTDAILSFAPTVNDQRYVVYLNGAKHVRFENLTIEVAAGATFGWGFLMMNESEDIQIVNNNINIGFLDTSSSNYAGIVASGSLTSAATVGNPVNNLLIEGNTITGGFYSVCVVGAAATRLQDVRVINNDIIDAYYYGVYMNNQANPEITHNYISGRHVGTTTTSYNAISFWNNSEAFNVSYNNIENASYRGISISGSTPADSEAWSLIYNNSIGGGFWNTGTACNGIYITSSARIGIYFNSINMDGASGRGINTTSTAVQLDVRNNSFAFTGSGAGYAAYYATSGVNMTAHDFNNYFQDTSSNFVYYDGAARANLAALQAVNVPEGNDQNSLQGDPMYTSTTNLLPMGSNFFTVGVRILCVEDDILSNQRMDPPTIGAYEILPLADDVAAIEISGPKLICLGVSSLYSVTVVNMGSNIQNNFSVNLMKDGSIELVSQMVTVDMEFFDQLTVDFEWSPTISETTYLYGEIVLAGDQNPENDQTPQLGVEVISPPIIGDGTEENPYHIESLSQLRWIAASENAIPNPNQTTRWSSHYIQTADIDASETVSLFSGQGWSPIGNLSIPFIGSYDGQGHFIEGLFINRPNTNYIGLFGYAYGSTIERLGLTNVDITGSQNVGGLIGSQGDSSVSNSYSLGIIIGTSSDVGGLVGSQGNSSISDSYSVTNVNGHGSSGGLVGQQANDSTIMRCFSNGSVNGNGYHVGGLVGYQVDSITSESYSMSSVHGLVRVGGLVGTVSGNSSIINSFSTGNVSGAQHVRGLVGSNFGGYVVSSFWDMETSGQSASSGGAGRSTAEMTYPYSANTYTNWEFNEIWGNDFHDLFNNGYPFLLWQSPPLVLLSPVGGELWQTATTKTVYWQPNWGIWTVNVLISFDNGMSWVTMNTEPVPTFTGQFSFTVPSLNSDQCLMRIESFHNPEEFYAVSENTFTITTTTPPLVSMITPPGPDQKLQSGRVTEIYWASSQVDSIDIDISYDSGVTWHNIAENIPTSLESYNWLIPDSLYTTCYFRVVESGNPNNYDWSDHPFIIAKLELLSPSGGEVLFGGANYPILWESINVDYKKLEYSHDNGENWVVLENSIPANQENYIWTLPHVMSDQYLFKISDAEDETITDQTEETFEVYGYIAINHPNSSVLKLQQGRICTIDWSQSSITSLLNIEYSADGGNSFHEIASAINPIEGSYDWLVPDVVTNTGRIKLALADNPDVFVVSEHDFTISKLELTSPSGGEIWGIGSTHAITWDHYNISNVKIEYRVAEVAARTSRSRSWLTIVNSTNAASGSYDWLIPDVYSEDVYVRVSDVDSPEISHESEEPLTIRPQIILESPNEGDLAVSFTIFPILWNVSPDVSHVVIHYSINGGENWLNIQSTPYPAIVGQYDWLVPNTLSDQVLVRVTKHSENDIYVISDGEFSIIEAIVPPTADFTADVTEGLEPLTVQFTDESQPASYISSWLWDFGDDEGTSTERHPEYTYQAPGSYTVSLTVTTIMDESDTLTREDYITVIEREPEITLLTNTEMSFGSANIAEFSSYQPVVYSNTGTANLVVSDINFIDVPEHFEMLHQMRNVMLEPGEIDTLYVRFAPQTVGTLVDTLFITSNAVNQPLISIRLQGTGLYVPPKAPENVDITMDGYDAVITWDPVTENEHGEPIDPDFYAVYYNGSSDIEGQYYFHGLSYNTDYTHDHVSMFADHMFYMVKAIKIYAPPTRSREYAEQVERYFRENLKEGMTEEGVSEVIQNVYLEF